jgi:branched-chain amino acid transport system ATP-binding protein
MLAIARALMSQPKLLLFDEPSFGLAPIVVKQVFDLIAELRTEGAALLVVEQNAHQALAIADRAYVLERGAVQLEGLSRELRQDPLVVSFYLGETR